MHLHTSQAVWLKSSREAIATFDTPGKAADLYMKITCADGLDWGKNRILLTGRSRYLEDAALRYYFRL
ncbi:MAG: hypothetical protein C4519_01450 [Desulfobacteraceae bacterium]|nr:MAG: hypothetical protein C4519_01450 [Desulfobacteraceae bacterium]